MNQIDYLTMGFWGRTGNKIGNFFRDLLGPIGQTGSIVKAADPRSRIAVIGEYLAPGFGYLLHGRVEKGLAGLAVWALYLWYMVSAGWRQILGQANLEFLNMQAVSLVLTLVMLYIYLRLLSNTLKDARSRARGERIEGSYIAGLCRGFTRGARFCLSQYGRTFRAASPLIKVSMVVPFFVMGVAQFLQKQFVKGLLFLAIQGGYIAYMALTGVEDLIGLFTLRVEGVQSNFCIVYGLVCIFLTLTFLMVYVKSISVSVENAVAISRGERPARFRQEIADLAGKKFYQVLLLVPILGAVLFTILPLSFMILMAFTDYGTSGTLPITNLKYLSWTGLQSFEQLFTLSANLKAFVNVVSWSIIWTVFATLTCYFGGIFLALLINKPCFRHKTLFRSMFVVVMAVPQFVSLRVMYVMFHEHGPINALLTKSWGLVDAAIPFWQDPLYAKILIIVINMWVGIPYFMLLCSGLLMNIPKDLYEYAQTEGASKWYMFRKITFPHLLFMTTPLLISNFVSNINNFNVIWLLTGGGPMGQGTGGTAGATDILITWLFKLTMQNNPEYNLGAAIGILMFLISATLSLVVFRRSSAYNKEEEFQ